MLRQLDLQQECTLYVRNLDERVSEKLLEELFIQVGPVNFIVIREPQHKGSQSIDSTPKVTAANRYAFVEFADVESVLFACEMMDAVELYGQKLKVQPRDNTEQKAIFTQLNMHTASWERHHSSASNPRKTDSSSTVEKDHPSARLGTGGGGQRIVTFNQMHGEGRQISPLEVLPLAQAQKMQSLAVRAYPKGDCQPQTWPSHSPHQPNFAYSTELQHQQMQLETPNYRHIHQQQNNFGGRRSAPYYRERGHPSRESAHRKSDR